MLSLKPPPNFLLLHGGCVVEVGYFGHRSVCWKCSTQASTSWSTSTIGTRTQGELGEGFLWMLWVFFFGTILPHATTIISRDSPVRCEDSTRKKFGVDDLDGTSLIMAGCRSVGK